MSNGYQSWTEKLHFALKVGLFDQRLDVSEAGIVRTLLNGDGNPISNSADAFSMDIRTYVDQHAILGDFCDEDRAKHRHDQIADPSQSSTITFVRGTPKASLVHHISSSLGLDPECILEYYGFSETFRIRSLPSRSPTVATIRFSSLGMFSRAPMLEQGSAQLRAELNGQLKDHYRECLTDDRPGVERCRRINVHDARFFTVEQQATLLTYEESQDSWSGVWFTDFGSESSSRPWIPRSSAGVEAQFYPVTTHGHCSMAPVKPTRSQRNQGNRDYTHPNPFSQVLGGRSPMSEEDCRLCEKDPFMFLSTIYDTSALTWMQTFSYLRASFESLPPSPTDQAPRLRADKEVLDRAICYFTETISFLEHPPKTWQHPGRAKEVASRLVTDFAVLRNEAESLSKWCSESISIAMSTISILDSQKSLAEARRVQFITYLAFILIPMTFIASCFGMNIQELADPGSSLRMYFTVSVPFTVIMLMIPAFIELRMWREGKREWRFRFR